MNSVTKKDIYPLPLIEECIATLSGNECFSKLDSSLLLHLSIDIICSAQEVFIAVETEDSWKVYAASRSDGFSGVDYSVDEILKFQEEDPDLELVLQFLRAIQSPLEEKLFISSKAAKKLWRNKELFVLDGEGILRNIHKKQGDNRLVVPQKLIQELLSMCHDLPASGHQSRTYARVKETYYWYDMSRATEQFVKSCARCNLHEKANRKAKCPMARYHARVPMERVHLELLVLLPESASDNTNILVVMDQFTKWMECIALPSQTAEVTARAAVNEVFLQGLAIRSTFLWIRDATLRVDFLNRFARYSKYIKVARRLTVRQQTNKLKGSTEPLWMQ